MGLKKSLVSFALAMVCISTAAHADVTCGGTAPVGKILPYRDDRVLVFTAWRGDFIQICNLDTAWKGIETGTCFAWMSQIASDIANNKPTAFFYYTSEPNFCTTVPYYGNAPSPGYIEIKP